MGVDWTDIVFAGTAATPAIPAPPLPANVLPINGGSAYARKALADECADLANTRTGRNHRLNVAAFNMASLVAAGHLDRQEVIDALTAAANIASTLGDHPLTTTEIANTIESGFRGSHTKVGARHIPEFDTRQVTNVSPEEISPTTTTGDTKSQTAADPHHILDAENGFWDSRPSLTHIYTASLARMCSPWAVLAHCAARALCLVRPCATLPPLIGGPGSLNWFGIIVAPSGGGKSAAEDVARELINHPIEQRSLGSGEGFMESYQRPENKETGEPAGQHESIMFIADESDTIGALNSRSGSTLLSTLRTAWTGRTLSFGYRGRTNDKIAAHTYRTTLIMAVQPSRAGWILEDAGGGTPQRFHWFPGIDRRITLAGWSDKPLYPLPLPSWREWEYDRHLTIPDAARTIILTAREQAARGEQGGLDGHALFCREKFAYALTVLDGRAEMSDQDWELSGIAAHISTLTRDWVCQSVQSEAYSEAEERGRLMGVTSAASDEEKAHLAARRIKRIGRLVMGKLEAGPMGQKELLRTVNSRDRPWIPNVLDSLNAAGVIELDGQKRWQISHA